MANCIITNRNTGFVGIDTSNVISTTTLGTNSYTATQDCILIGGLGTAGEAQQLLLNGVRIGYMSEYDYVFIPLKKGDTIKASGSYGFNRYTYIFGIRN